MRLELRAVEAGYGALQVLWGIDLSVDAGEVACLVGRNGVGKSTTLKTIMGLADLGGGEVRLDGKPLPFGAVARRVGQGIGYVAQERELCPDLTVRENLLLPLYANKLPLARVQDAYRQFPRLEERASQRAGSLSGGERKLLAFARIMLLRPRVYLIDEPTEGLMPSAVAEIGMLISALRAGGAAVLMVEQNLELVRNLADRVHLMNVGRIEKTTDRLSDEDHARFLGV